MAPPREKFTWYPEDCVWYINGDDRAAIRMFLVDLYYDKVVELLDNFDDWSRISGAIWMRDLYQNGTLNLTVIEGNVARLAASMTAQIRTAATLYRSEEKVAAQVLHGTDERGFAYGHATTTATCISVQWGWLAYPASLVALTIVFIALSAWNTRRGNEPGHAVAIWKSTSLAVLFGGPDEGARERHGLVSKTSEMQKHAEDLKVILGPMERGWRLVEDEGEQ